jgi:hypothetical protein
LNIASHATPRHGIDTTRLTQVICDEGRAATITHAPCGFQAVVLVFSTYAWILWFDVLAFILILRVFRKTQWLGSMRRLHIVCHLVIWPASIIMTFIVSGFGLHSDGILSCTASFDVWDGFMQDALLQIPIAVLGLLGTMMLAVVLVRVAVLSLQHRLGSVASTRLFLWAVWGIFVTMFNVTYYFQLRAREHTLQANNRNWIQCSADHPFDYEQVCHLHGDRVNFSVALLDLLLDSTMPIIGFAILLSKKRIWAQWVYYFRRYILRDTSADNPFKDTEWYKQQEARKQLRKARPEPRPSDAPDASQAEHA